MSDIRYAIRTLLRAKWFTIGAALTFALGIGVNVAVFSLVDRILFRPLPYGHAGQLAVLAEYARGSDRPAGTLDPAVVSAARSQVADIVGLATTDTADRFAAEPGGTADISLISVSSNVLRVLEVAPVRGRGFSDDDVSSQRPVILLKEEIWRARFGGAPEVIGRTLWRGRDAVEIVGILPAGFIQPPTLFDPKSDGLVLNPRAQQPAPPGSRETPPTIRLRPGIALSTVEAEIAAVVGRLRQDGVMRAGTTEFRLSPIRDAMFGRYAPYLWLVVGAASIVLMLCCVNLASLLIVRGRSREQIVALQIAIGASPGRVIATALVESTLLAIGGAAVAAVVVALSQQALIALLPATFNRHAESMTDLRVTLFSIGAAAACAIAAGLIPSVRAARVDVLPVLQRGARTSTARLRGGGGLIAIEAALGVVLVAGAAMTTRSLIGLLRTDVGFEPAGLHSISINLPGTDPQARFRMYLSALDDVRALPGIRAAAAADILPVVGAVSSAFGAGYERRGQRWQVTDGFFETMGMRLVGGRTIRAEDLVAPATVAVLSERGATLVWPGEPPASAVGKLLTFPNEAPRQVIGVVSDVVGGYADTPWPSIYVPISADKFRFLMYVARTDPAGGVPLPELRARVQSIGGASSTVGSAPITARLANGIVDQKFRTVLFGVFGAMALVLAATGLYAITAFDAARRRTEMGIRISLGAAPTALMRLLISEAIRPVAIGVAAGLVLAWWAGRFLQSFLHQVDARDPWTLGMVAAILLATAAASAYLPARRAARTDPILALRAE